MVFAETVSWPIGRRSPTGTNPVRKLCGNSSKRATKRVAPRCAPHLIQAMPPTIDAKMPTVAEVIANGPAAGQPNSPKDAPMAAAVPWPPTKPAARIAPKPGCRSDQIAFNTPIAKASPRPHCSKITTVEYAKSSATFRPTARRGPLAALKGRVTKISAIRIPG